jgi:hypothetical protein
MILSAAHTPSATQPKLNRATFDIARGTIARNGYRLAPKSRSGRSRSETAIRLASAGAADWPGGIRNGRPLIRYDLVTGLHARISRPLRQAPARLGLATEFFFLRHERTTRIAGFGSLGAPKESFGRVVGDAKSWTPSPEHTGKLRRSGMVRLSTARAIWLSWLGLGRVRWAQPRTRPL